MGAPESGIKAAEQGTAETLLSAFRTIKPAERAKHANILDYWLSIRGDKDFPPLHDLDPLEISDAGPCSILLELISGGQDAEIRHLGDGLGEFCSSTRIIDAPNPSILHSIARKLPIVAISRDILAYEDDFSGVAGRTRCWVTLLPLSSCGSWVDYVYAFVSVETANSKAAEAATPADPQVAAQEIEPVAEAVVEAPDEPLDLAPFVADEAETATEATAEPEAAVAPVDAAEDRPEPAVEEVAEEPVAETAPGFSTLLQDVAKLAGFYGQGIPTETIVPTMELTDSTPSEAETAAAPEPMAEELPVLELDEIEPVTEVEEPVAEIEEPTAEAEEPAVEEASPEVPDREPEPVPAPEPTPAVEGALQTKLSEVRAMGEEARQAQIRATAALYEGLSAAYDFALDAESHADEYFKLVQEKGLKVQLRAPMAPVAKLAFDGVCDAETIAEFEAILAWALKEELPRGTLAERIDQAGGISELLNGVSRPS